MHSYLQIKNVMDVCCIGINHKRTRNFLMISIALEDLWTFCGETHEVCCMVNP